MTSSDPSLAQEQCPRCFGDVHPDATACRHCGATLAETGWFTPVQRAILAWVAAGTALVVGMTLANLAEADGETSDGGSWLVAAAVVLGIVAIYYTLRAATRR